MTEQWCLDCQRTPGGSCFRHVATTERDADAAVFALALWEEFGYGDAQDVGRATLLAPTDPYWAEAAGRIQARIEAALRAQGDSATSARNADFETDMAAMRSVEQMVGAYVGSERAPDAANDIIAKLRLGGFVISRPARALLADVPDADEGAGMKRVGFRDYCRHEPRCRTLNQHETRDADEGAGS